MHKAQYKFGKISFEDMSASAFDGKGVLSAPVSRSLDQLAKGGSRSAGLTHLLLVRSRTCAVKLPDKSIVNV